MENKTILINGEKVNGAFSFTVTKNENVKPAVITVEGIMSCGKYIEEIDTIENEWFRIRGVNVFSTNPILKRSLWIQLFCVFGRKVGEPTFVDALFFRTE